MELCGLVPGLRAVEIHVRDTGPGIPAEDLPYIFDRFHQVDGTVSAVQEGTGIGLALVKELIDLHGGTIEVESAPGQGTEFIITLPRDLPLTQEEGKRADAVVQFGYDSLDSWSAKRFLS